MNNFTAFLSQTLTTVKLAVAEKKEMFSFESLKMFFANVVDGADTAEVFSEKMVEISQNVHFMVDDRDALAMLIFDHPLLVVPQKLQEYLKITADGDVAAFFITRLFKNEPEFRPEIVPDEVLVHSIDCAYHTVLAMSPESIKQFAETVIEMWPNLPKGEDGDAGLWGKIYSQASQKSVEVEVANLKLPALDILSLVIAPPLAEKTAVKPLLAKSALQGKPKGQKKPNGYTAPPPAKTPIRDLVSVKTLAAMQAMVKPTTGPVN